MPTSTNDLVTVAVVVLFVLGLLYRGYLASIRQWIRDKVSET